MKTSASRCGFAPEIQHSFSSFHLDDHVVPLLCHSCISGDKYHKQVRQGGELVFLRNLWNKDKCVALQILAWNSTFISLSIGPRPFQNTEPQVFIYFLLSNTHNIFRQYALVTWCLIYDYNINFQVFIIFSLLDYMGMDEDTRVTNNSCLCWVQL